MWKDLFPVSQQKRCDGCFPITAYSEFMPPPRIGKKPLGKVDQVIFHDDDPYGWYITELEEEYELRPGLKHSGQQILNSIIKLGKGLPEHHIHGHGGENLKENPYWPPELSSKAGMLTHEKFVTFLPLMLSGSQDDKGRVIWSLFGNSISDPENIFWKNFYSAPDVELDSEKSGSLFSIILNNAYNEKITDLKSLFKSGFRIMSDLNTLPSWTKEFLIKIDSSFEDVKYLLTFIPFSKLPEKVKELYLNGKLSLLPFPGSLVFWGMPGYEKLKKEFPLAGQIPALNLVARNRGIGGLKVSQSGWIHEPRPDISNIVTGELVKDSFHRTHRWQRLHRYQDELNEAGDKITLIKVLFSTEPEAMGLYDKPLARNSHIWDNNFDLVLNGPDASREKILQAEKKLLQGGLFGYRFFYPPFRAGEYDIYLNRILAGYLPEGAEYPEVIPDFLPGYITGYHKSDIKMKNPLELWPRLLRREPYLLAISDFRNANNHYVYTTTMNIIALFDAWYYMDKKPLQRSFARSLLNISKSKTLEQFFEEFDVHASSKESAFRMRQMISEIIEPEQPVTAPENVTYSVTASRAFEENWWNDIKFLAHGQYINKDNADVALDPVSLSVVKKQQRDLESLGDYLIDRHRKAIKEAGMEGKAFCGETPFKWKTDFEYPNYGGWKNNQLDHTHERNILVVIPGKNRKEAVVMGDHYDTAYMEDVFDKSRGGSGARVSANGADDNYSATSTLLQAAPIFLRLSGEGKLERDVWLIHLTGEEFPSDCMGARNFCQSLIEKNLTLYTGNDNTIDLSDVTVTGVYVMDMIGHNRDNDQDVFQISPGKSPDSLNLALQAHLSVKAWNDSLATWNNAPDRINRNHGKRITEGQEIPDPAKFLFLNGQVRTKHNPHSSIFNTDGQIFSDVGVPVVLFMENYDINRTGYHDTKDTMENIDLDYGAAFAAIAIETVARVAGAAGIKKK